MAKSYRAYALNAAGKIERGDWFDAADDEAARRRVDRFCLPGVASVELWQGARRIDVFPCIGQARRP